MKDMFFISDTHFGHQNILNFVDNAGKNLRNFKNVDEMNEHMINCWNNVVRPYDRVYHCGDVVINKKYLATIMPRLNGKKVLIMGNHDIFGHAIYLKYFEDIRAYKVLPDHAIIASHIPIHPDHLRKSKLNIHGHLHSNKVVMENNINCIDDRYFNVSVECINYTPISLDEILQKFK